MMAILTTVISILVFRLRGRVPGTRTHCPSTSSECPAAPAYASGEQPQRGCSLRSVRCFSPSTKPCWRVSLCPDRRPHVSSCPDRCPPVSFCPDRRPHVSSYPDRCPPASLCPDRRPHVSSCPDRCP